MSKSKRHTRSGAGRSVSQANGAAFHSKLPGLCQHEIVSGTPKRWKQQCGAVKASCGCLVGHGCMGVRVSVFQPHNSATNQFQVLRSVQMDAEFKKEQTGAPFVWVGALEEGFGGWVVPLVHPKKWTCLPKTKTSP